MAEERARLVRLGLTVVLGEQAEEVPVTIVGDVVWVGEIGDHAFGLSPDTGLDDPRTVIAHDIERLADELCEFQVGWGKRLPECPAHPNTHALLVEVTESTVFATCPIDRHVVRAVPFVDARGGYGC